MTTQEFINMNWPDDNTKTKQDLIDIFLNSNGNDLPLAKAGITDVFNIDDWDI